MGQIEINHTGSGGGVVLSSDGTSLLLGGSAIGGGGGASALTIEAKTSAYTVVAGDLGKVINCTANTFTVSLTAAGTLGAGFNVVIWNTSATNTHAITIDPNGSETIDGLATLILRRGEGMQVVCDGSNFQTGNKKTMRGYADNVLSTDARPVASGNSSVAVGNTATASGDYSFAGGGYNNTASNSFSLAMGSSSQATANTSVAIGSAAIASGTKAVAVGRGLASGEESFAAAITNNSSSYGASGTSSIALGNYNKSSGTNSASLGGYNNVSSGNSSFATGYQALASGAYGVAAGYQAQATEPSTVALGYQANASALYSIAIGNNAKSAVDRQIAFSAGRFAALGDAQGSIFILRVLTSNDALGTMTTNNSTAAATNQVVAASDTCIMFSGTIVAMQNGAQDQGGWEIKGLLKNDGGTTTLVNSEVRTFADGNGWSIVLSADNTNNALKIQCAGEASHNIRWVANIQTSEVTFA